MGVMEEKDFSSGGAGATAYLIGNDSYDENATSFSDTEGSDDDGNLSQFCPC